MLDRFLPEQLDNRFRGHRVALRPFAAITVFQMVLGLGHISNPMAAHNPRRIFRSMPILPTQRKMSSLGRATRLQTAPPGRRRSELWRVGALAARKWLRQGRREQSLRGIVTISRALLVGILAGASLLVAARAQGSAVIEKISFEVAGAFERGAVVSGELRIPDSKHVRLPAVVIVNSSPGFDGRGAFYAEALNGAGLATLEIDVLQGRGIPATPSHNMPHAYQTLRYLARHLRIDGTRIGIMGFSWGAILSMLTSSEQLTRQYSEGDLRFGAHLGIYPQCWSVRSLLSGKDKTIRPTIFERVTGRPVHILAGDRDDYDDRDSCSQLLAGLSPGTRSNFALTVYEGATFGWDSRFSSAFYSVGANKGVGGIVTVIADPDIAHRSREYVVTFFKTNLAAD